MWSQKEEEPIFESGQWASLSVWGIKHLPIDAVYFPVHARLSARLIPSSFPRSYPLQSSSSSPLSYLGNLSLPWVSLVDVLCTDGTACTALYGSLNLNSSLLPYFISSSNALTPLAPLLIYLTLINIGQLLRRSNQTRMNHFVRSLIWIHLLVENHQEVE